MYGKIFKTFCGVYIVLDLHYKANKLISTYVVCSQTKRLLVHLISVGFYKDVRAVSFLIYSLHNITTISAICMSGFEFDND